MTFLPDHRTVHPPEEECDTCRREGERRRSQMSPPPERHSAASPTGVRNDLVFAPGTNPK